MNNLLMLRTRMNSRRDEPEVADRSEPAWTPLPESADLKVVPPILNEAGSHSLGERPPVWACAG